MAENRKKDIDRFLTEYEEISSKEKWDTNDLEKMKNLLKCIYYKKMICSMDEASQDGYEDISLNKSYARGNQRHSQNTGRFMSGTYPSNNSYYDDGGMSGRRYYDDQKQMALHRFESIAEAERDPEMREAMKELMRMVQNR